MQVSKFIIMFKCILFKKKKKKKTKFNYSLSALHCPIVHYTVQRIRYFVGTGNYFWGNLILLKPAFALGRANLTDSREGANNISFMETDFRTPKNRCQISIQKIHIAPCYRLEKKKAKRNNDK